MNAELWSLLLGSVAALANVLGGLFIVWIEWQRRYLKYFIAVGSGFMLATVLLEMLPESFRLSGEWVLVLTLGGYLLVHFAEHTLAPHLHVGEEIHREEMVERRAGYAAVLGLLIHSFFDGVAIASGFIISTALGALIFFAVFLHKFPVGFTAASLMLASGHSRGRSFAASALMGGATLAGLGAMWLLEVHVAYGLALSAGATLYVAGSDLIPEVNREPGIVMSLWVFVGVGLMLVGKLWLPG